MSRVSVLLALLLLALPSHADYSNFRVGLGWLKVDMEPSPLAQKSDDGITLFAEFPQTNYTASRFLIYRLDGTNDTRLRGFETQLMWGYGLAQPGLRLYTGPAWHRDSWHHTGQSQRFQGWGWHLGSGIQYQAITVDITATYRRANDYRRYHRRQGIHNQSAPILGNVLISYRF